MISQGSFFADAHPSFARIASVDGRIAVVDVGSNSVRLVVFDRATRAPSYFFNEKLACGLGAQIATTGRLDPRGREMALATLRRFAALAERMGVVGLDAVATAAMREAEDGPDFRDVVEAETGLRLRVITGDEEARLSAQGVLFGEPGADGAAADMGGASLELASLDGGGVGPRITLALGPQRLDGFTGAKLSNRIDAEIERAMEVVRLEGRVLYVVGGAWRSFAKIAMARANHPLQVLHGYRLDAARALETAEWIAGQAPGDLRAMSDVSAARSETAPLAATVLSRLIARMGPSAVSVSAFGLREGIFFERLPQTMRRRDPLIEACRTLEAAQARFPGFGDELADWVTPLITDWPARERMLAHAACLLNDVNWRAHPDYRPVSCFETMTRANLAGVDHPGRVFIGFALMNRYGGGKRSADVGVALEMLDPESRRKSKALGRALRLGAMISASSAGALADAALRIGNGGAALELGPALADLAGAAVDRRLAALNDALAATT